MRIVVVGVGGVGGMVGGLLARSGSEVAFVARGRQLEALRRAGLRIESPRGTFHLAHVEVSDDPSQLAPADVVLVAVKSWQVAEVAPRLAPLLRPEGFVVPLENGVDAADILAGALGDRSVAGGFCAMLAWRQAPGFVKHAGAVLRVLLGERAGGKSPRLAQLAAQLSAANIDVEVVADVTAAAWEKFLFIVSFGAVAAATRAPARVVRELPQTRDLLVGAMEEVATLARARGIKLDGGAVSRAMSIVDALPPEATASMQRDILGARPSELQDQSGAIVRMARESGVPVPIHTCLLAVLLPQEQLARASAAR